MTDANGSATAGEGQPDAGTPDPTNGGAAEGSPDTTTEPFAGLETGTREWVETKGYKSVGDLATAAQNAESLIGRSVQIPGDDAKPEDVQAFIDKATEKFRPAEPTGYELALPDGLPENMPYDGEFADAFKGVAHEARLTSEQARGVHDFYVTKMAELYQREGETLVSDAEAAKDRLVKEWGADGSQEFQTANEMAFRALKAAGDTVEEALAEAKLIYRTPEGQAVVRNPDLAIWLSKVGKANYSEDSLESGSSAAGASADNPFAEGSLNITKQHQAIRGDPKRARRLMIAAGKKPGDFGLSEDFDTRK